MGVECGVSENNKCDCCGTEQVKTGEYEMLINGRSVGSVPYYNIDIMTHMHGRKICEDCMDKAMYVDSLFTGRDVSRGGIKYFADGRERESV